MRMRIFTVALVAVTTLAASNASAAPSKAFLKKAIEGDNSEMRLGALAEHKGSSQATRDFGHMLNTDHTEAKQHAVILAQGYGMTPPTEMAPEAKVEYKKLQGLSGPAFDREFASYMVKDHTKDISDFEDQSKSGDAKTSALATQTLPTLRKHLETAKGLASS